MFTGLIEEVGIIKNLHLKNQQQQIVISCQKLQDDLKIGDSVAVDGVCLTVIEFDNANIKMEISNETLQRTLFRKKDNGDRVNLERALSFKDRLGGHLVQGHVDGCLTLVEIHPQGRFYELDFKFPQTLKKFFVVKGSIAINGISLTIASLQEAKFSVAVIPHTYQSTTLAQLKVYDQVHFEIDLIAKYTDSLLQDRFLSGSESKITHNFLADAGF